MNPPPSFAYLFERFPKFTQTFCFREAAEMLRQEMNPAIFSVRTAEEPDAFSSEIVQSVRYLPEGEELTKRFASLRGEELIPEDALRTLKRLKSDQLRVQAAVALGPMLQREDIRHVHAHFAGIASRTAYWLKKFYGITYSFTGHANDIFCETNFPVPLADLVREARFVATETNFSRDWMRKKFPEHARKIHRVYNGIEAANVSPSTSGDGKPLILSVGRCIEKKGFGDLIEACRILKQDGVSFECRIVGGGPLEANLRALADRSGLADEVILTGPLNQGEVVKLLARSTIFALACVREADGGMDNLPTVIMEAMSCALPVVSTRLAGVPEMVVDGETGFLVSEKNPAELAEAIRKLLSSGELARTMGTKGREVALRKFSTEATTRRLKYLLVRHGRVKPTSSALALDPKLARLARKWAVS